MKTEKIRADIYLLITAIIWGFSFVSQRMGMETMQPYGFNAVRFLLAALSLLPVIWLMRNSEIERAHKDDSVASLMKAGVVCGLFLFAGSSLQQIGIQYTTAGKAAFITGLYVVLVPILGIYFLGEKTAFLTWVGAGLAVIGLYFLSINAAFDINKGDVLELIGSLFWAGHVLAVFHWGRHLSPFKLSFVQITVCMVLSFIAAFNFEILLWSQISVTIGPLLFAGIGSVGIAFTLQILGQRVAPPAHAAVLLSMETVFAAIGGWLFLQEFLNERELFGCLLMLGGMLLSQSDTFRKAAVAS